MDNATPSDVNTFDFDGFWKWMKKWARRLGREALLNVLILYHVLMSPGTPMQEKLVIVGAFLYLVCPVDFIPDGIPVVGLTDDITALATAVGQVSAYVTPEVRRRAEKGRDRILK